MIPHGREDHPDKRTRRGLRIVGDHARIDQRFLSLLTGSTINGWPDLLMTSSDFLARIGRDLKQPDRDRQSRPLVLAPQLWPGQQYGLVALVPNIVIALWVVHDVIRNGPRLVGRGVSPVTANPDSSHTQLSRSPGH